MDGHNCIWLYEIHLKEQVLLFRGLVRDILLNDKLLTSHVNSENKVA